MTIRFYANDTFSNLSYEQIQVVKQISEERGIFPFSLMPRKKEEYIYSGEEKIFFQKRLMKRG